MRAYEKKILDKRLPDFLEEVVPVDLLPYLPCLTKPDKENIEALQNTKGPTRATALLVDRLKRRDKAFAQFVLALRRCGSGHTALLLDPYCHIVETEDESADAKDESGLGFKKMGTAIDVSIRGNLLPLQDEVEQLNHCREVEAFLAETYQDPLSDASKRMRADIQEHLPAGAAFVHTARGSIISTFRLSSVSAASKLWEMYSEGRLQSMLQEVLVDSTLKEGQKVPEKSLELKINLGEEKFKNIQQKLAGETADDDEIASEIQIDIPPVYLENGNPLERPELKLRDYQKELADPALEGKNTIICAPTNSGKTFVAIEIAKNHLDCFSKGDETCGKHDAKREPRVVFIVSTVNLVLQQKDRFELYLGDKYSVTEISGANQTETPLKYLLQGHKVVIMTAQILVNALNSNNKEQQVQLSDISLLIFDECHHAQKEHSYNQVMEKYKALKLQPGNQHKLPQIVGLTASLGTGKAKSVQKAEEHIVLICANLDAEVVSTVRKHQSELQKHVNGPKSEVFQVAKNDRDPFERIINQVMDKIHGGIKRLMNKSFKGPPPEKAGQQYRQWVEELYKDSIAAGDRYLVTYAEQLREYHIALSINTTTRMKNAKLHLQKYFESLDEDLFTETDRNLRELFCHAIDVLDRFVQEHGEPQNPRLVRLKQLLLDHYKAFQTEDEIEEEEKLDKRTSKDKRSDQTVKENAQLDKKQDEKENEFQGTKENDEKCENENLKTNCGLFGEKDRTQEMSSDGSQTSKDEEHSVSKEGAHSHPTEGQTVKEALHTAMEEIGQNNSDDSTYETQEINLAVKTNCPSKEKAGPKGILFTRTRESTEALLDWIEDTEELNSFLRPEALVGSGNDTIGMTPREQEKVIKRFQTGEKNILLATSVAEEGLDISDCNYVIRYEMMGNEISSVQSRGRVRAKAGKYSLVVSSESGARKREDTNRYRECLMVEALRKIQGTDPETFIKMVEDKQRKTFQERCLKKQAAKTVNQCNDFTLRCRKCNVIACQARDLRRVKEMYHVVINCDFKESKVALKRRSKSKTVDKIVMAKNIFCNTCNEDWGVTALIDGVEWMCIKVRSFVLELTMNGNPRRTMYKQWKDVPFTIPEATVDELLQQGSGQAVAAFQLDDLSLN